MAERLTTRPSKAIVAAIDIGTAYSGYAFSFKSDFDRNPLHIYGNLWTGQGVGQTLENKIPTILLLKPNQSFYAFGPEAESEFEKLSNTFDDEEETFKKWYYFEKFKMNLFHEPRLNRNLMIKDIFGKEMPALKIFSMVIAFFKDDLLGKLQDRGIRFRNEDICWVLTVPAIWSNSAKQFMREAAKKGGIDGRDIILAYEPEAIAMFCSYLPKDQLSGTGEDVFTVGKKILLVDLGGGTADFTVQKVTEGRKLQTIHNVSGGPWGGEEVNQNFIKFIEGLFGKDVLEEFKRANISDYQQLMQNFESRKRQFDVNSDVILRIPSELGGVNIGLHQMDLSQSVSLTSFKTSIKFIKDKMSVDKEIFRDFFKEPKYLQNKTPALNHDQPLEAIINHTRKLTQKSACADISTFIMAGGFSESKLVIDTMKREFPEFRIIVPISPGLAVLKGAVLFGHRPDMIRSRYCAQTYGISLNKEFDPRQHKGGNTFISGSRKMCEDCFEVLFKIGDVVDVGTTRNIPVYSSHDTDDRQEWRTDVKEIEIFTSNSTNPTFVTDPGCQYHGTITVSPPGGRWQKIVNGRVEMEVGGTEITVRYVDNIARDITSSATVDFMWYSNTEESQVTAIDRESEVFYARTMSN